MNASHLNNLKLETVRAHVVPVSDKSAWVLLEARLADGSRGFGEVTCFGQEASLEHEINALNTRIPNGGVDIFGPALALLAQAELTTARALVRSGLEQALYDALSRASKVPLTGMLGGRFHKQTRCYANINRGISDRTPSGFASRAIAIAEQGYQAIKIAPFDGYRSNNGSKMAASRLFDLGVERITAVRNALAPEIDLMIDCHARFDLFSAGALLKELQNLDIFWLEDIVDYSQADTRSLHSLRQRAHSNGTRLAGGEQLRSLQDTNALLAKTCCDVILPDLRLTGIRNAISILQLATEHGVSVSLHNPVGPVLDAISQHVAASLPSFLILERQVGETPLFEDLGGKHTELTNGNLTLNQSPGFGFEIDDALLEKTKHAPNRLLSNFTGVAGAGPDA